MKFIARNFRTNAAIALFNAAVEGESGQSAAPTTEAPKLTRAEKQAKQVKVLEDRIAADTAKLAELKLEIETSARLDGVTAGSGISARIGRGETSQIVQATVLGVKEDENTGARRYKIAYGNGFDADTVVIQPAQIVSVDAVDQAVYTDEYGRKIDADGNLLEQPAA